MHSAVMLLMLLMMAHAGPAAVSAAPSQDCADCPRMVDLPAGSYLAGSPVDEAGRYSNEPVRRATRVAPFSMALTEVTRREFAAFVKDTDRPMEGGCYTPGDLTDLLSDLNPKASWSKPGFDQTDDHPVVCVSWIDARDYARWLSARTGRRYRLPSEAEWEYAARGRTSTPYFWGTDVRLGCRFMNGGDLSLGKHVPAWAAATRRAFDEGIKESRLIACDDGAAYTAKVASYRPNPFGLYDITGNVWEWVEDCADDSAREEDCKRRRTRGGSWDDWAVDLRAAVRKRLEPDARRNDVGIRLVRER